MFGKGAALHTAPPHTLLCTAQRNKCAAACANSMSPALLVCREVCRRAGVPTAEFAVRTLSTQRLHPQHNATKQLQLLQLQPAATACDRG